MGFADFYFQKFNRDERIIKEPTPANLSTIITIPSFKEKDTIKALESLYFCEPTRNLTEVIVILNYPENKVHDYDSYHRNQHSEILNWIGSHKKDWLQFHVILKALPSKDAGVGLARKIAMDEAARRFNDIDNKRGIIVGFDADCTCSSNYLAEIEKNFQTEKINGCSIYYEHPLSGSDDPETYKAIIYYELYLRYYIEALRFAKFPYAFHTLGSSFAVTAEAYVKQGGMNKRKAGEDFYFIHKIIPMGNFSELNSCSVFPSPRVSDRVPFGTGAAVNKIVNSSDFDFPTYNLESFYALKNFFKIVPEFYKNSNIKDLITSLDPALQSFLNQISLEENLHRINSKCTKEAPFLKALYNWFNGLVVLQFLNQAHETYFKKVKISEAVAMLLKEMHGIESESTGIENLEIMRRLQNPDKAKN